ncbi:MAG: hypothetical protein ACP5M4_14615 [Acidobacteriaceae bacterium]
MNAWLKGQVTVSAIAKVWPKGPVIPIKVLWPATANPGEKIELRAVVTNNKAGHDFATGPLDLIRAWVELEVRDAHGNVVFHSGELTPENHIEKGTIVIRSIGVNVDGKQIRRHHLWNYAGTMFKRSIPPGDSDMFNYEFTVPKNVDSPLHVTAVLRYRKANQYFINFVFPGKTLKLPTTNLSSSMATIYVAERAPVKAPAGMKASTGFRLTGARGGK